MRIALLVDDLGTDATALDALWPIAIPFSVAVFPHAAHSRAMAEQARATGKDVLVHLPMEPLPRPGHEERVPAPGELTLAMSAREVQRETRRAIRSVPKAVGINNHQGSAFCRNTELMTAMLEVVRDEHLFFVDSRTIADTVGFALARTLGVPTAERQVFVDHDPDPSAIRRALETLEATARERSTALGICHPLTASMEAIAAWLPAAAERGFEMVPVSAIVG